MYDDKYLKHRDNKNLRATVFAISNKSLLFRSHGELVEPVLNVIDGQHDMESTWITR